MVRYKVAPPPGEPTLRFSLEEGSDGSIYLIATEESGRRWQILAIFENGKLRRFGGLPEKFFRTEEEDGKIALEE